MSARRKAPLNRGVRRTEEMRIEISWLAVVLCGVALLISRVASASVTFEIEMHPALNRDLCGALPAASDIPQEEDFLGLLRHSWVSLVESTYDETRKWPCMQRVVVTFPTYGTYVEFASSMSRCPQYPFYSGADYALQTAIFERAVADSDEVVIQYLMKKNGLCASELNPPLFSILRKNPLTFLRVYGKLSPREKRVVVETQYDFNSKVEEQQFSPETTHALPDSLRKEAESFNQALSEIAE